MADAQTFDGNVPLLANCGDPRLGKKLPMPDAGRKVDGHERPNGRHPGMNRLTNFLLRTFLNHKFKRYGNMTALTIDSSTRTISLTATLAGETEPLDAKIRYEVSESEGRISLIPKNIECSREWLTVLANEFIKTQPVSMDIPGGLATAMARILKL